MMMSVTVVTEVQFILPGWARTWAMNSFIESIFIAVGTTTVRVLESAAALTTLNSQLSTLCSRTRIFIHPPYQFRIVDALLTNFHLPQSTLLMLVSAFAAPGELRGRELILAAYAEAVRERYRFFSYGDAMLIV